MAVKTYELNGKTVWQVYVNLRSKVMPRIRLQKVLKGIATEKAAEKQEKILIRELADRIARLEAQGVTWGEVIDRWESGQKLFPTKKYAVTTIQDHAAMLRNWTKPWLKRCASDLNRGDGREILRFAESQGKLPSLQKKLKNTVNVIYRWGIEERLIMGVHQSPVFGLEIEKDREEKMPEILAKDEIRVLLRKAKEQTHPWYPVWSMAILTGMRSGELQALNKSDLELVTREEAEKMDRKPPELRSYGIIRVRRTYKTRQKEFGPTKGGYWRNVPVSRELYWFLIFELKVAELETEAFILPRHYKWVRGEQASILRAFCQANQLTSVKFHTLRACFATQLISAGVPATVVMKIGGWKDIKTMQRYIRMAGIDERGATEVLNFIPTEEAVMEKVVSMSDFKARRD